MKTKNLSKLLALILALAMVFSLAACGGDKTDDTKKDDATTQTPDDAAANEPTKPEQPDEQASPAEPEQPEETAEPVELIVFAAASMTETLGQIKDLYEAAHPNVTITYSFDSSGTLKTQIEEGADCDIFISAAQKQMNQLDIAADPEVNKDGLDFVLESTRINLLENKVALAVPADNPANIQSYDDLKAHLEAGDILLAMGNSDVPVGQYTQKILTFFGLNEEELASAGVLTYGSNVKEVTTQVSEGAVDCGIIYATDANAAGLTAVDEATADMCGQVIYPAAILKNSPNPDAAKAFLDYLTGDSAGKVFKSVGFTPIK